LKEIPFEIPPLVVSPAPSSVREELSEIVRVSAAHSGLTGFVWQDAEDDDDFGYTSEMRLAFLRTTHADPWDLTPRNYSRVDVSLPTFDNDDADEKLVGQWTKARQGALTDLLKQMRRSAASPISDLPILMEENGYGRNWLVDWENSKTLPPPLQPLIVVSVYPATDKIPEVARRQSKFILLHENVLNDGDTDTLARSLKADLGSGKWDGYVLDFKREEVTQGKYPLDSLVRAVNLPLQKRPGITDTKQ